eukprot:973192_1
MSFSITSTSMGVILAVTASIFNAIGYTVQKQGHNRLQEYNEDKTGSDRKRLINEKIWALGFAIYLMGGVLNAISLFYAPQSLVLPLSAVTLVVSSILATKLLAEPLHNSDILGVLCVIIGSVLAVLFGPTTNNGEIRSMNELKLRWIESDLYPFFLILSICAALDYLLVRYYEKHNTMHYASSFLLVSYCLLSGYFGSLAFIFLKSFTQFIGALISNDASNRKATLQSNWYSYVTVLFVVVTNIALEWFRQKGLSRFNAVYVVPINQVVLIVMGTVMGGIYFEEFEHMSILHGVMFCVAIVMTVIGVFILALNSSETPVSSTEETSCVYVDAKTEHEIHGFDPPDINVMHRTMASISLIAAHLNHVTDPTPTPIVTSNAEMSQYSQSEVENVLL